MCKAKGLLTKVNGPRPGRAHVRRRIELLRGKGTRAGASMYNGPARGGTRGGKDKFNWDDVKNDNFRENYLGHSTRAEIGRWTTTARGRDHSAPYSHGICR